jgi:hypothetical protein
MTQLGRDLAHLPAAFDDLAITLARQARIGGGKRGKGHEEPLPIDLGAIDTGDAARGTLTTWARTIIEDAGDPDHAGCTRPWTQGHHAAHRWAEPPPDSLPDIARWLLAHIAWARHSDEAAQFADEIHHVRQLIERRIDRPADLAYAGPCGADDITAAIDGPAITFQTVMCGSDLYARLGAKMVTCRKCGAQYDVAQRKAWLLESVGQYAATTHEVANALTSLMQPVTPSMIRQMAYRNELYRHGETPDGTPLYLINDVIEILRRRRVRQAEKALGNGRISA